jgi:hypothetical protein
MPGGVRPVLKNIPDTGESRSYCLLRKELVLNHLHLMKMEMKQVLIIKKMMELINASAYTGFIGIEYEGEELSSIEGIQATKNLLLQYFPTEF